MGDMVTKADAYQPGGTVSFAGPSARVNRPYHAVCGTCPQVVPCRSVHVPAGGPRPRPRRLRDPRGTAGSLGSDDDPQVRDPLRSPQEVGARAQGPRRAETEWLG